MASDRDTLAELIDSQGIDLRRDIPFGGWPADEVALYTRMSPANHSPDRVNRAGQLARRNAIQRLRAEKVADAVLAAGFRPPARVIETVEALAALPIGTVALTPSGKAWTRITETRWEQGRYGLADSHALIAHHPVMTVLWTPEQEARR